MDLENNFAYNLAMRKILLLMIFCFVVTSRVSAATTVKNVANTKIVTPQKINKVVSIKKTTTQTVVTKKNIQSTSVKQPTKQIVKPVVKTNSLIKQKDSKILVKQPVKKVVSTSKTTALPTKTTTVSKLNQSVNVKKIQSPPKEIKAVVTTKNSNQQIKNQPKNNIVQTKKDVKQSVLKNTNQKQLNQKQLPKSVVQQQTKVSKVQTVQKTQVKAVQPKAVQPKNETKAKVTTIVNKQKINTPKKIVTPEPVEIKTEPSEIQIPKENLTVKKQNKFKIFNFKKNKKVKDESVDKIGESENMDYIQDLKQQAVALYDDNNLEESLKAFLRIPEKYRSPQDYVLMGNLLQDMQRLDDAIFMYKRALLIDETYYKAYYNLGTICLNEDKFYMSIDYFKKAIRYNPKFAYSYYNLGCAYIKTGDLKKAKSQFNKAIELKNTEPDFHYNLAYVYKKLNKPKLAKIYLDNYNRLTNSP